jgi:lysyl-tRNA synthetase class 2
MPDAPPARFRNLALRSRVLHAIRSFFHERGYLEVETPVRLRAPALELHIDAEPSGDHWLRTSPELHMKRLLAEGHERLFQLGPCFRRGERGPLHHPEYTMLEWYRAGAGYRDLIPETAALLAHAARAANGATRIGPLDLSEPWHERMVSAAFLQHAGWDPCAAYDADRFDLDLVDKVEPALPRDRPVVLIDYPAEAAALARLNPANPRVAERWELYAGGVELANAYGELVAPDEQRTRFEHCAAERTALGRETYPLDEAFLAALPGVPPCAGIALGVDRLVMLLAGAADLDDVMAFRE